MHITPQNSCDVTDDVINDVTDQTPVITIGMREADEAEVEDKMAPNQQTSNDSGRFSLVEEASERNYNGTANRQKVGT